MRGSSPGLGASAGLGQGRVAMLGGGLAGVGVHAIRPVLTRSSGDPGVWRRP